MTAYHQSLTPDKLTGSQLDRLLAIGWYRMHQYIFTTTHLVRDDFYRVHWLRYPLGEVREHASHRKIRRRNNSFRFTIEPFDAIREDHEAVYIRYRTSIDFAGPLTIRQGLFGEEGVDKGMYTTHCISIFDQDRLIAGGYFDVGEKSGTSILHFFDPAYARFSPGKYLMLLTADFLRAAGYVFYYPGYVVAGDAKMDYKLFIGKEATEYFDPESGGWKYFEEKILTPEVLSSVEQIELLIAFGLVRKEGP